MAKTTSNPQSSPTIQTASGQTAVPPQPNARSTFDPANPSGVRRNRPPKARDPKIERYNQELHAHLALDDSDPRYDADRIHALHYLAAGQEVPGSEDHPGLDVDDEPAAEPAA